MAKFGDKVGEILIDALNTRKTEAKFDEKKFNELVASMQALISLNHGVSVGFPSINGAGHFNMCVRLRSASFEELAEAAFFFAAIGEPLEALKEEYAAKGYSLTSGTIDLETMQVRMSFAAGKDHSNLPERVLSVSLEEDGTVTVARLSSW